MTPSAKRWDRLANTLQPMAAETVRELAGLEGQEADHVGLVLVAVMMAVQKHDAAALTRLAHVATGAAVDAPACATLPRRRTPGEERRRQGRIRRTEVRGTIRKLAGAGWAESRDLVSRLARTKRATEGEVLEVCRQLEADGEVERRVVCSPDSNAPVGQLRFARR